MTENINNINDNSVDEVVLFETRPNKVSEKHDKNVVLFCIFVFSFFIIFGILSSFFYRDLFLKIVFSIIISIGIAFALINTFCPSRNKKIKITDKAIYYFYSATKSFVQVPLDEIRNIYCKQGVVDKKVNCADIKINTVNDCHLVENINEYRAFCRVIKENARYIEPRITFGEEIRKKVASDEKIIWEGRGKGKLIGDIITIYFFSIFLLVLAFALFFSGHEILNLIPFFVFLFLGSIFLFSLGTEQKKYFKKTYYILTDKRFLYCDINTDATCWVIPLETIDECIYCAGSKRKSECIEIKTQKRKYYLYSAGNMSDVANYIEQCILARKYELGIN